jgi:hypothetical protein
LVFRPTGWLAGSILCLCAGDSLHAQAWDDRLPNVVTIGFGGSNGGVGARYVRQFASVPVAVGAGFGVLGPAAHVDLTIRGLAHRPLFGSPDENEGRAYVGLGLLVVTNRASHHYRGGELVLEGGTQTWPRVGGDRFFTDFALGIMVHAWGPNDGSSIGPSLRAQVGYAF